jgi:transposase-like protein
MSRRCRRGLTGVAPVASDSHRGLVDAIGATLPGAMWQRQPTRITRQPSHTTPAELNIL